MTIEGAAALTGDDQRAAADRVAAPAPAAAVHAGEPRPLIAHVIFRLAVGGLENGLVNIINRTPQYRHAVVCLTDYTDFHRRIRHDAVSLHALHKREGHDLGMLLRLWRLLRTLRPDIVHSRNLAALEAQLPAVLAGVRGRVHGEHGRDVHDLDGSRRSHRWLRRAFRPLVQRYVPLSRELEHYLREDIAVPDAKIVQIYNGVDAGRFHPAAGERLSPLPPGFAPPGAVVIGTVGRLAAVKDQLTLVRAFVELLAQTPQRRDTARLVIVGDGELRRAAEDILQQAGVAEFAWLPGARDDVPELMRALDVFVLPSLAEGISNTILEAMASGLPVIATRVGGNAELVAEDETGTLVPAAAPKALAEAIARYADDAALRERHGRAGRARVEREFSIEAMVASYVQIYERALRREAGRESASTGTK